ncbi:MAG: nucleoside deaminase [Alphaproteobacteria bacterium]|nr:nucleoside deaminase [Alphaproteobacteria bacterium]
MNKRALMQYCITLAEQAGKHQEVPVAAVIADKEGAIIAQAQNRMRRDNNPTAHAELLAIKALRAKIGSYFFSDYQLFVSLEPCPMCAHAIALMRFDALYFAAYDVKAGGVDHGARIFAQAGCNHVPEIIGGFCSGESEILLQSFFQTKR